MIEDSSNFEVRQQILKILKTAKEPLSADQLYKASIDCMSRESLSKEIYLMCKDGVLEREAYNGVLLCYKLSEDVLKVLGFYQQSKLNAKPGKVKTTHLVLDALHTHYQEDDNNESCFMSDAQLAALVKPSISHSAVRHAVIRLINAGNEHLERKPGFSRIKFRPESECSFGNKKSDSADNIKKAIQSSRQSVLLKDEKAIARTKPKNAFDRFLEQAKINHSSQPISTQTFDLQCSGDSFSCEFNHASESVTINHYGEKMTLNLFDARKLMYFIFSLTE